MDDESYAARWQPILDPVTVGALFADYPGFWCIGGGWALDLFVGVQSRPHEDVDVIVARSELALLHPAFPDSAFVAAHGKLTPWHEGEPYPEDAHDIWRQRPDGFFDLQLMVSEFTDTEWIFRRDGRIRGPLTEMITTTAKGLPIIAPEIQLLYKSSPTRRLRDEQDFAQTLPHLSAYRRAWLASNLVLPYGDHAWLSMLREPHE